MNFIGNVVGIGIFQVVQLPGAKQRTLDSIDQTLPFLCYKTISEYFGENRVTP